jgi:hypothetical protein
VCVCVCVCNRARELPASLHAHVCLSSFTSACNIRFCVNTNAQCISRVFIIHSTALHWVVSMCSL